MRSSTRIPVDPNSALVIQPKNVVDLVSKKKGSKSIQVVKGENSKDLAVIDKEVPIKKP